MPSSVTAASSRRPTSGSATSCATGPRRAVESRVCATPRASAACGWPSERSADRLGRLALLDGAPLAHGAQDEGGDHGHAGRGHDGTDERAETVRHRAVALALDADHRVADQPAAYARDEDRGERKSTCAYRREGRRRGLRLHTRIVRRRARLPG